MIQILYIDGHGRKRPANVSETFPHQGETVNGTPVQTVWEWDWTEVPFGSPNACLCEKCDERSETNDTAGIHR